MRAVVRPKTLEYRKMITSIDDKVSVQGVVALGSHFATFCQEVDFYEASCFQYQFSKRQDKHFHSFNRFYSKKSSNRAT